MVMMNKTGSPSIFFRPDTMAENVHVITIMNKSINRPSRFVGGKKEGQCFTMVQRFVGSLLIS